MPPLEYFKVECADAVGGDAYEKIASDVLLDLDLVRVLERLHIYIDPKVPIFVAVGRIKNIPRAVRVRDFANVNVQENKATVGIGDEAYLAPLLTILWGKYGKEHVDQPDRFTIVLNIGEEEARELEDLVVADPSESLYKDIIYAMQYIAPEGFKVRRQYVRGTTFYYVASEDTLPEDIVETLVAEKLALAGVEK